MAIQNVWDTVACMLQCEPTSQVQVFTPWAPLLVERRRDVLAVLRRDFVLMPKKSGKKQTLNECAEFFKQSDQLKKSGKKQPLNEYAEFFKQSDQLVELLDTVGSNVQSWSLALPPGKNSCTDPVPAAIENEAQSAAKLQKDMLKTMRECKEGQSMAMDCARAVLDKVRQLRKELRTSRANVLEQESVIQRLKTQLNLASSTPSLEETVVFENTAPSSPSESTCDLFASLSPIRKTEILDPSEPMVDTGAQTLVESGAKEEKQITVLMESSSPLDDSSITIPAECSNSFLGNNRDTIENIIASDIAAAQKEDPFDRLDSSLNGKNADREGNDLLTTAIETTLQQEQTIANLRAKIDHLEEDNKFAQAAAATANKERVHALKAREELEETILQLQAEMSILREQIKTALTAEETAQKQVNEACEQHKKIEAHLREKIVVLEDQNKNLLEKTKKHVNEALIEGQQSVERLHVRIAKLVEENQAAQADLKTTQKCADEAQEEYKKNMQQLRERIATFEEREKKILQTVKTANSCNVSEGSEKEQQVLALPVPPSTEKCQDPTESLTECLVKGKIEVHKKVKRIRRKRLDIRSRESTQCFGKIQKRVHLLEKVLKKERQMYRLKLDQLQIESRDMKRNIKFLSNENNEFFEQKCLLELRVKKLQHALQTLAVTEVSTF